MSILMVRIQIYIIKCFFTGKIYNMCKYKMINIDLKDNKWTFLKFEIWKKMHKWHFQSFVQRKYYKS